MVCVNAYVNFMFYGNVWHGIWPAGHGMTYGWLVVLRLNVPVNNFSVMSGRSHRFLGN